MNEATATSAINKSKKKAKKKKKKKKPALSTPETPEDGNQNDESEEDEIDKAIKDLNITTKHPEAGKSTVADQVHNNDLFRINPHHLRAANEMRNLFGRDIMESTNAEEEQENTRRRRQRLPQQVDLETFLREPPGAQKLPEISLRRNVFVQGREHWPRQTTGGLTMHEIRKSPDGSWTEYAYSHDKNYDGIQTVFFACVQMGDPMRMVHLLKQFREQKSCPCS